jgi:hypothetical protein
MRLLSSRTRRPVMAVNTTAQKTFQDNDSTERTSLSQNAAAISSEVMLRILFILSPPIKILQYL